MKHIRFCFKKEDYADRMPRNKNKQMLARYSMALIVQKFGGTSVADIERIKRVAQIIRRENEAGHMLVVVVSAMAGVTNSLISQCSEVSSLSTPESTREYDALTGSGEILTAGLLALELQRINIKARSLQGWQIPILTDEMFTNARVQSINSGLIQELIKNKIIPVITGFQGVTQDQHLTTLGKGGSDTTAALVAAAIGAERADIYTDVRGVFTADPRVVHHAAKIDYIPAELMITLSGYGAKVLHPRAALAAARYGFDIRILSSFEDDPGTLVGSSNLDIRHEMENRLITAITSNKNILQINIICANGNLAEVIEEFAGKKLIIEKMDVLGTGNLLLIASLADKSRFQSALEELKNLSKIAEYEIRSNISTVTLVGYGLKEDGGFCFSVANLLGSQQIKIKSLDVTETRLTAMLEEQDTEKAIKLLHQFFLADSMQDI